MCVGASSSAVVCMVGKIYAGESSASGGTVGDVSQTGGSSGQQGRIIMLLLLCCGCFFLRLLRTVPASGERALICIFTATRAGFGHPCPLSTARCDSSVLCPPPPGTLSWLHCSVTNSRMSMLQDSSLRYTYIQQYGTSVAPSRVDFQALDATAAAAYCCLLLLLVAAESDV